MRRYIEPIQYHKGLLLKYDCYTGHKDVPIIESVAQRWSPTGGLCAPFRLLNTMNETFHEGAAVPSPVSDAPRRKPGHRTVTEQEGFEPPVPYGTTVFKTVAFSRSATSPNMFFRQKQHIR